MNVSTPTIEMRPIEVLRPYAGNARTHSKKQIAQIAENIRRFGFTNQVLVSDDDEIVAGHGRVLAAKELKPAGTRRSSPSNCRR
jgi:ParB-like chromosome segregation protein Spo0J